MFLCQAPGLVPEALLQRDMNLRALALAEVAGVGLGYLPLGIGGAVLGWHAGALVAAHVGQALVKSLVLVSARAHPRALLPERAATRDLLSYSGGVVTAGLCNFAASQGDNVVVGRWMSADHLGIYGRAYQLMAMPAMFTNTSSPIRFSPARFSSTARRSESRCWSTPLAMRRAVP